MPLYSGQVSLVITFLKNKKSITSAVLIGSPQWSTHSIAMQPSLLSALAKKKPSYVRRSKWLRWCEMVKMIIYTILAGRFLKCWHFQGVPERLNSHFNGSHLTDICPGHIGYDIKLSRKEGHFVNSQTNNGYLPLLERPQPATRYNNEQKISNCSGLHFMPYVRSQQLLWV